MLVVVPGGPRNRPAIVKLVRRRWQCSILTVWEVVPVAGLPRETTIRGGKHTTWQVILPVE